MAFGDPIQWLVIGVVVIVIILWGPSKIPEFARSVGRAKKELEVAKKGWENPTDALLQSFSQPAPTQVQPFAEDILTQTARRLGIVTEGKTREQIANEIVARGAPKNEDSRPQ